MNYSLLSLSGLILTSTTCFSLGEDWPQFRGPNSNGKSSAISKLDLNQAKIAWKAKVGFGASSFAIAEGKVYTMGNSGGKDTVYCFDSATGKEIWKFSYACSLDARQFEGGPASTPSVGMGHVYTFSHEGDLHALNAGTGKLAWKKNLKNDFGGKRPRWGWAGSPSLVGEVLVVEPGAKNGSLIGLDPKTGALKWSGGNRPASYSTPVAFTVNGQELLAIFNAYGLSIHDRQGKLLDEELWKTDYNINAAVPIVVDNSLFISSGYGSGAALYKVSDNGRLKAEWRQRDFLAQMPSPVLHDGYIYGFSGTHVQRRNSLHFMCLDITNGAVKWKEKGLGMGNVILVGNQLVVLSMDGKLLVAEASSAGFKPTSERQILDDRSWVSPAFADGRLYVKNNNGDVVVLQF